MDGPGVMDEVVSGPGMSIKEILWHEIALEPVAAMAGGHEIARRVRAAAGEWQHVVQRGDREVEGRGAVHTAAAAIPHGGAFDGELMLSWEEAPEPVAVAGRTRETGAVEVPSLRQLHLVEKTTPRDGSETRRGV